MSEPIVSIRNVSRRYPGGVTAVDNVSIDIAQNEFFALLGPSGCGKTTLLRMISGLDTPTEGQIFIGGEDMALTPPNLRPTNMVFQSYAVFPHMTVEQNVGYGLKVTGVEANEIKRRTAEALEMVKLSHLAARKPDRCRVASVNVWPWPAPLLNAPKFCCSMSPCRPLTPSCVMTCVSS